MYSVGARLSMRALLLLVLLQFISLTTGEGIKRVPQGFVGMRGKKDLDYDDTGPADKRRQGFVGVKGKKDLLNYLYYPYDPATFYKRAPTGFVGMRGKKIVPADFTAISAEYVPKRGSIFGQIDYGSADDFNSDFSILNDLVERYLLENSKNNLLDAQTRVSEENFLENKSDLTKRAAQMGQFFGMRGKKSDVNYRGNKRPFDLSFRGKFVGVRGKKSVDDAMDIKINGSGSEYLGMRGKPDDNQEFSSDETTTY